MRTSRWKQGPPGLFLHSSSFLFPLDVLCRAPVLARLGADRPYLAPVLAFYTKMVLCACGLQWEKSKFGASCFCKCCSNVRHLWGLKCMLENCQLCCDNMVACAAAEAFVLLQLILSFCNKNALSSTPWPNNLASAAFKGTKLAVYCILANN